MIEPEEIWDNISLKKVEVSEKELNKINSKFEIDSFLKTLKVEILLAVCSIAALLLFREQIPLSVLQITFGSALAGLAISSYGLYLVKSIDLSADTKKFLTDAVRKIKYLAVMNLIIMIIALAIMTLFLSHYFADFYRNLWIYFSLLVIIILASFLHIKFFYMRRINNLRQLLKSISE